MDSDVDNLRTIYAIVCLQEAGWIGAPLIVTANVLVHALLSPLDFYSCVIVATAFGFFLTTGLLTILALFLLHRFALDKQRRSFLLPYLTVKIVRTLCLAAVSIYVVFDSHLRRYYFYVAIYGLFECSAATVSAEIVYRSWQVIRRARLRRRLAPQNRRDRLLRPPSVRSTQSVPG